MSRPEEVPELSAEARAFLDHHQTTGEPSAAALARVRARLATQGAPTRPVKRAWLRSETMAAAAVLVVMVGAQGLYLFFRAPDAPEVVNELTDAGSGAATETVDAAARAVLEAYRSGDVAGAARLAAKDCGSAVCGQLASKLAIVLGLSQRLETLSTAELEQLAQLDHALAEGRETALGQQVAQLQKRLQLPVTQAPAEQLYRDALAANLAKDPERARRLAEQCLTSAPDYYNCYKVLGSALAKLGALHASEEALDDARTAYERFLELAPPDDEAVPKVRAILETSQTPREVRVAINETKLVALERDNVRVAVGDPGIAEAVLVGPRELRVRGVREGMTSVLVWTSTGARREFVARVGEQRGIEALTELLASATDARSRRDLRMAVRLAKQIQSLDPGNAQAEALLQEARPHAQDAYLRGYQLKDSDLDGAVAQFELVLELTSPDDEYHQKAIARLADLREDAVAGAPEVIPLGGTKDLALAKSIARIAVGDSSTCDVQLIAPQTVRVRGLSLGMTSLLIWFSDGERTSRLLDVRR